MSDVCNCHECVDYAAGYRDGLADRPPRATCAELREVDLTREPAVTPVEAVDREELRERYAAPPTLYAVQFSNYSPAEIDSTWTTEARAVERRDELNKSGETSMWCVEPWSVDG